MPKQQILSFFLCQKPTWRRKMSKIIKTGNQIWTDFVFLSLRDSISDIHPSCAWNPRRRHSCSINLDTVPTSWLVCYTQRGGWDTVLDSKLGMDSRACILITLSSVFLGDVRWINCLFPFLSCHVQSWFLLWHTFETGEWMDHLILVVKRF